jgi:hypothetical protein
LLEEKISIVKSFKANLVEAQKLNKNTESERKMKDEKIAEQNKVIHELKNEIEKMKASHDDNISRLDLEIDNLKQEVGMTGK